MKTIPVGMDKKKNSNQIYWLKQSYTLIKYAYY